MDIADRVLHGDAQAIARATTLVEQQGSEAKGLIAKLHEHTGNAKIVGLTGAPGVGKSTLVSQLVKSWRSESSKVGVIAVDPTSPFTGGAILGDRIRLQEHASDGGVFVRSMATRGHLGGLAPAVQDAVVFLDAAGNDIVAIETVGGGQAEVDVSRTADACIVITVPGTGDDVQAIKAGVMEIADIFVINKSDREGSDKIAVSLNNFLSTIHVEDDVWSPHVIKTSVYKKEGVEELVKVIFDRSKFLDIYGGRDEKHQSRYINQVKNIVSTHLNNSFWDDDKEKTLNKELSIDIQNRRNPVIIAKKLINE